MYRHVLCQVGGVRESFAADWTTMWLHILVVDFHMLTITSSNKLLVIRRPIYVHFIILKLTDDDKIIVQNAVTAVSTGVYLTVQKCTFRPSGILPQLLHNKFCCPKYHLVLQTAASHANTSIIYYAMVLWQILANKYGLCPKIGVKWVMYSLSLGFFLYLHLYI